MALCVSVAIEDVITKIDKLYDYCVPNELEDLVVPGVRVVVPFSKSNMRKKGVVLEFSKKESADGLKYIISVADDTPVINQSQIELIKLLKTRYFITYYQAFKAIVPRGIDFKINEKYIAEKSLADIEPKLYDFIKSKRGGVHAYDVPANLYRLFKKHIKLGNIKGNISVSHKSEHTEKSLSLKVDKTELERYISELDKRFERQRDLLLLFLEHDSISYRDAIYYSGCSASTVKSLEKKGYIDVVANVLPRSPYKEIERKTDDTPIQLTQYQETVYKEIISGFDRYSTHLVHGVTGSGKTLIYMSLIDKAISSGKSVIFMVPEISLTPQTLEKFYSRFGDKVAVVHSGLATGERADEWRKIKSNECSVIVGTRSSVFSPVNNLGLVIIDEEHESSYKSESSPRYHARDIAKYICSKNNIPLILGSATPSVESFYFAQKGIYKYHKLDKRYNNNPLPEVEVVDMCDAFKQGEQSFLSENLKSALDQTLSRSEQAILFLNRRGANSIVGCRSCGYIAKCPNCEISLTYHLANNRCMCHYCGYSIKAFEKCPECDGSHIKKLGIGTQLIFDELQKMYPNASILRMDFDTVSSYLSYGEKLTDFKNGKYDILLGTQMVAKGLDFPNVTLVGVINADLSLYVDDFRSSERTFSLLTQVCGRSGRAGKEGKAIIQTYSPDNEAIIYSKHQDYQKFFDFEINHRRAFNYPPFCDIIRFVVTSKSDSNAYSNIQNLYNIINKLSKTEFSDIPIRLLYPTVPKIARYNEKYRYNLIMKSKICHRLYELLETIQQQFSLDSFVELSININPMGNV